MNGITKSKLYFAEIEKAFPSLKANCTFEEGNACELKFHRGVEFYFVGERKSENCKNIKKVVDKYIGL